MFGELDAAILRGERVGLARYRILTPTEAAGASDVELARAQGWNELLQWLRQDSFCEVAELVAQ